MKTLLSSTALRRGAFGLVGMVVAGLAQDEDLMKIQRDYFLPLNEEAVKEGRAASWATTWVRYPQQVGHPYNYVSFNGYASLTQMDQVASPAFVKKWGGERQANVGTQLAASRQRVKGQLWTLLEQTTPRQAM